MRGVPRASVMRRRFVPGLPRSVGFGPVAEPLFFGATDALLGSPGSSRLARPHAGALAEPDAGALRRPPSASRADAASNSSCSHSPARPAASSRAGASAARTGSRSARPGSRSGDDCPSARPRKIGRTQISAYPAPARLILPRKARCIPVTLKPSVAARSRMCRRVAIASAGSVSQITVQSGCRICRI